jgi:hypothetical protein
MSETYAEQSCDTGNERRMTRRRRVLLGGHIADPTGAWSAECTISNVSDGGAQIRIQPSDTPPDNVYLIDLKTHYAHLSRIAWQANDRVGLSFRETLDLETELPERLTFLKTMLIEAKLKQVEQLQHKGTSLEDALSATGVTRLGYDRWRRDRLINEAARGTMERLLGEYRNLLVILASARQS